MAEGIAVIPAKQAVEDEFRFGNGCDFTGCHQSGAVQARKGDGNQTGLGRDLALAGVLQTFANQLGTRELVDGERWRKGGWVSGHRAGAGKRTERQP